MKDSLSGLRHAARGCLNAVKLCVSALELDCTHEEQMEFIDDVIHGADKMCACIDELSTYFDSHPAPDTVQNA
jgi:hypothetical protein